MKPEATLTYLEREPLVYFGCTWSEIKKAVLTALLISVLVQVVLFSAPLPFGKMLTIIPSVVLWLFLSSMFMRRIRAMRTGKPLYYDRHLRLVKNTRNYIQPDDLVQVERNRTAS